MFGIYFAASAVAIMATFGLDLPPETRLYMYFFIGLTVFGVFGSFTYYLPELFPTRLRGTGAGFCYNVGRVIAAAGPFLVGTDRGARRTTRRCRRCSGSAWCRSSGCCFLPWVIETRGRALVD